MKAGGSGNNTEVSSRNPLPYPSFRPSSALQHYWCSVAVSSVFGSHARKMRGFQVLLAGPLRGALRGDVLGEVSGEAGRGPDTPRFHALQPAVARLSDGSAQPVKKGDDEPDD